MPDWSKAAYMQYNLITASRAGARYLTPAAQ